MNKKDIDWERFSLNLSDIFRLSVSNIINFSVISYMFNDMKNSNINYNFSLNVGSFYNRFKKINGYDKRLIINDIYAPNFAILDFLIEEIEDKEKEIVIDYNCGIGCLLIYLKKIGFNNLYGFDKFIQFPKKLLSNILDIFDLKDSIIENVYEVNPTIFCLSGAMCDEFEKIIEIKSLKYILCDYHWFPENKKDYYKNFNADIFEKNGFKKIYFY